MLSSKSDYNRSSVSKGSNAIVKFKERTRANY